MDHQYVCVCLCVCVHPWDYIYNKWRDVVWYELHMIGWTSSIAVTAYGNCSQYC